MYADRFENPVTRARNDALFVNVTAAMLAFAEKVLADVIDQHGGITNADAIERALIRMGIDQTYRSAERQWDAIRNYLEALP